MADAPVGTGQIIDGKYRVDRVLGRGAMGLVVEAWHVALERRVALKFMLANDKMPKELSERFLREARVASKLQSQHAAKVLDVGMLDGASPYIVMEFLEGKDLAALLRQHGPFTVEEAVTYILQASEAVAEAHALGIVHRDIKPANLFLSRAADGSPCIKLVDFGVAKQADGGMDLTATEQQLGSPLYMSPEAINASRDVDGRTDIWALGICLYELLARITPFQADTLMALCTAIFFKPPVPLEQYRSDVPAGLSAVIMQCLEKDRARRFPTVAAFAAALAPYAPVRPESYVERVAKVQGADVAPVRRTDLLPAAPAPQPAISAHQAPMPGQTAAIAVAPYPLPSNTAAAVAVPAPGAAGTPAPRGDGRGMTWVAIGASLIAATLVGGLVARKFMVAPMPAASVNATEEPAPSAPDRTAGTTMPAVAPSGSASAMVAASAAPVASTAAPPAASAGVVGSAASRPKPAARRAPEKPAVPGSDLPEGPRR